MSVLEYQGTIWHVSTIFLQQLIAMAAIVLHFYTSYLQLCQAGSSTGIFHSSLRYERVEGTHCRD